MAKEIIIKGKLGTDFTNVSEKQEFYVKNRKRTKEGIFISVKEPEIPYSELDFDGIEETFTPAWMKEDEECKYYNGKTNYKFKVYNEENKIIDIEELGGVIPYGSEVQVALKKSEAGTYYPYAIKIDKFNDEVVDENPFK